MVADVPVHYDTILKQLQSMSPSQDFMTFIVLVVWIHLVHSIIEVLTVVSSG